MTDEAKALVEREGMQVLLPPAAGVDDAYLMGWIEGQENLIETQAREIDLLREALTDPSVVHANMLAGYIAKPWPKSIWHIYGRELLDAMPDEYRAALAGGSHDQ